MNQFDWNTNAISPGTEFMDKLSTSITTELNTNKLYENIKVYFSDAYNAGEGEHKILEFIRTNELEGKIVVYGLDADLIVLSFVSQKNNIFLLREALSFGKPIYKNGVSKEKGIYFLGLPWLSMRGSSFIWGVWKDAKYLAEHIANKKIDSVQVK